ncbi:hypothetical protein R6Z07F_005292 [Ovis aries]
MGRWYCGLPLLLLFLVPGSSRASESNFELPDNAKQCFHGDIMQGTKGTLQFQVITGGHCDVDCRLEDPDEFLALRMVSEDQQCAGWLEVFYNRTWGSVCCSPMDDVTVSIICSQLGCGDSGNLNSSVALREGSRPQWASCQMVRTAMTPDLFQALSECL